MDPFYFNSPFAEKCWIRRHKYLSILAPFAALILFFSVLTGIQSVCFPDKRVEDPGALHRFFDGSFNGFVYSAVSWIFFVEDWSGQVDHYWFAYPFYAIPALVFLFARRNRTAIVAYALFCILVCVALFSGLCIIAR